MMVFLPMWNLDNVSATNPRAMSHGFFRVPPRRSSRSTQVLDRFGIHHHIIVMMGKVEEMWAELKPGIVDAERAGQSGHLAG